ncbi:unnamed protein product, partial [Symbiodinium sp. CCMP2592]
VVSTGPRKTLFGGSAGRSGASSSLRRGHRPAKDACENSAGVVVLGGGAAGLLAAMTAGRRGRPVTVLEKNRELGKKIRISGGGRCNFTNISDALRHAYHSSTPSSSSRAPAEDAETGTPGNFFQKAFQKYPPEKFIALVESHGIKYHEKKLGQLFCNRSANSIVDMLQEECLAAGVRLVTEAEVTSLQTSSGAERFRVLYRTPREKVPIEAEVAAEAVIVASGGLSFARTCGSTDLAHVVAEDMGLEVTGVRPGLVPLVVGTEWTRSLTGVSMEVRASIGDMSFVERILFTHRGVSGPAVLQASSFWGEGAFGEGEPLVLDLLPAMEEDAALSWLSRKATGDSARRRRQVPACEELAKRLPRRFAEGFWSHEVGPRLKIRPQAALKDLRPEQLRSLVQLLKHWEVPVAGTEGYLKAEVTCGGVSTDELSDETMECKKHPGLYFIGEAVDVTGWLG